MMLALAWLTISTPFVYNWQLQQQAAVSAFNHSNPTDRNDFSENPLAGTNEEKTESGAANLSEYLHDTDESNRDSSELTPYNKCNAVATYVAFHGELLSPPPEA